MCAGTSGAAALSPEGAQPCLGRPGAAADVTATPHSTKLAPGLALAVVGSIAFSGKAIIVKLAYRHGVDAVTLLMYRMLFALPFFAAMAWWAGLGKPALTRRDALGVLWLGFTGYYLASFLDFAGLQYITASLERLILYLNPTLVLLLGWLMHGRRIRRPQTVAMAVSYSGVVLVFGHQLSLDGTAVAWGALLVFLSTISYALYMSYSGELRPLAAAEVAPAVLWLSLLNATACTALPVLLVMMAIERIGPALTAQTGMIGPMSTILMGVVILGEPLNSWIIAGTVLVITGIYVFSRSARQA